MVVLFVLLTVQDSLQYLSLADATVLNLSAPLIAGFLTSDTFSSIRLGTAVVCLLGVGLVAKPNFVLSLVQFGIEDESSASGHIPVSQSTGTGLAFAAVGVFGGVVCHKVISKLQTLAYYFY